jgi:hypothetical protein
VGLFLIVFGDMENFNNLCFLFMLEMTSVVLGKDVFKRLHYDCGC